MDGYFDRYLDEHSDPNAVRPDTTKPRVDWITFGSQSNAETDAGIAIGRSTRADVYAVYGPVPPNPNAYYDALGIGFGFNFAQHRPYQPTDTVSEIWIFLPRSDEEL